MQGNLELVFYGELVAGIAPEQARKNIALLFKASEEQVERMFTGQRVVIRNKLDAETAQKYISAMEKRGAICQVEEMGKPGVAVSVSEATPTSVPHSSHSEPASTAQSPAESAEKDDRAEPAPETFEGRAEPANPGQLPLAGKKADEVLAKANLELDPVGVRLSEAHEVEAPVFDHLDEISIAPVGSDLGEKNDQPPISIPDTSHLSLDSGKD